MKLQFKLALYNTLTKVAIILLTGLIILISIEKLSYNHIELRLENAKIEVMDNLSSKEINGFLVQQKVYEDFNILKEEYILIKPLKIYQPEVPKTYQFRTEERVVDRDKEIYRILTYKFNFKKHTYQLEIGETIAAIEDLKTIIKQFTLVVLVLALSLTLVSDLIFTKYLLNPFYKIIDRKLIKVNDPMNFDYEKVQTTTQDFTLLDDSISSLMKKISGLFSLEKQFIANVSHELLTPISIISTRLENVILQEELSEDSENKIFASLKTLNRLKSIINSLLLISKVENNQFNKTDSVSIALVINEIAEELEDRLEDKKITLVNKMKYRFTMLSNRPLIHTLLFNIINNAIKYNYLNGSITIKDHAIDDLYILEIIDTGIGMNPEQIELAFNRFEKLDSDEMESYGLGLAIVKSIAAFHNINVTIESEKDKGTTFLLTFKSKYQLH